MEIKSEADDIDEGQQITSFSQSVDKLGCEQPPSGSATRRRQQWGRLRSLAAVARKVKK